MWGHKLNEREEVEKVSMHGKLQSATYAQTQSYIKPLLRKLKTKVRQNTFTLFKLKCINVSLCKKEI